MTYHVHGDFVDLSRTLAVSGSCHELTDGRGPFTETVKGPATGTAVTAGAARRASVTAHLQAKSGEGLEEEDRWRTKQAKAMARQPALMPG